MEFAERFGATVDVSTTDGGGLFFVSRVPSADHAQFRAVVAGIVGGHEYVRLDAPSGYLVVVTRYETTAALRAHPMVAHVGGVTVDPKRLPTPTDDGREGTDGEG